MQINLEFNNNTKAINLKDLTLETMDKIDAIRKKIFNEAIAIDKKYEIRDEDLDQIKTFEISLSKGKETREMLFKQNVQILQIIADISSLSDEEKAEFNSKYDSKFWRSQSINEIANAVSSFRSPDF
jgi:alpha-mannosidase